MRKQLNVFKSWFIWFLPAFFMFYQYGIQVLPSVKSHYIQSHYLINDFDIGMLNTFYLLPYVLLQLLVGILIDNFDVKKILSAAMLLFSFGTLVIFFSNQTHNYYLFIFAHLCMGAAASTGFIGTLYLANLWLSSGAYKLAISLTQMFSMLGVFAIVLVFNFILKYLDWSQVLLMNLVFCLGLTALFWFFIVDIPKPGHFKIESVMVNLKCLLKNKNIWLCALYVGCAFAHMIVLTNAWRVDFLESHYHMSRFQATISNGYSIFGYIIGAPLYGMLARKTDKQTLIIMISAIFECVLLVICHFLINDIHIKVIFYFFIGFFTGAVTLGFALIKQLVDSSTLATAIGLVNMMEIALGMLLTPLVGELLVAFPRDYEQATIPVVFASFVAAVMAVWLWRRV